MNPNAQPFVPQQQPVLQPTQQYQREFETVADSNFNAFNGAGRARSFSTGVYDPNTNMRSQRVHEHTVDGNAYHTSGKPNAPGQIGGNYTAFHSW